MVLRIIRDPDSPVTRKHVMDCLIAVHRIARRALAIQALPRVWWYDEPFGGARFGIAPTIYAPDLVWEDVVTISTGLLGYYEQSQAWEEVIFYVSSESRGAMAAGSLKNAEPDPAASGTGDTATS